MRTCIAIICLVLTCLSHTTARAQEKAEFSGLIMTGEAQVAEVIDPLRLRLLDGRIIQLAGIDIPDLTPYDTGDIGFAALAVLRDKLVKKTIRIYQTKDAKLRLNRMGYQLSHIEEKNSGLWIQGLLLDGGLARVRPAAINVEPVPVMLARELAARQAGRGLWADARYAVLTPETAGNGLNNWAIVEGTVRASAMANNTVYLNFGPDWRSDFTIGIPPAVRRELTKRNVDPLQLSNKTVRIHGWIENYNGPYIELLHPVWIEALPEPSPAANVE